MRKLILKMAITIDGVVAPENPKVFDHTDKDVWNDLFTTLESVDTILIGAAMHQEYLAHWKEALTKPTSVEEGRYAEIAARTPHFVLSRTLRTVDWPNVSVLRGGVAGIADLKNQSGRDIILWGGPTVAAAAIEAGVIDEYILVTHPAIAGRGRKLFDNVAETRRARHEDTKVFPSGIVILKYTGA
jgi:dihydrofolate reductase